MARPARIEVLGDDDRRREVRGQTGDHARQGLDPPGGRADDDELGLGRLLLNHDAAF